jgi:hypothetical protein
MPKFGDITDSDLDAMRHYIRQAAASESAATTGSHGP